jgi:hypothetical protein
MTVAAIAAALALPVHTPQSTMLAAMTAAAAAARPSDFAVVSESDVCAATPSVKTTTNNKSHTNYSVFSLVPTVRLPTIADTGAMQHTTNRWDLLHDFVPLAVPSQLMCADGGHIECIGHGTLRGITVIDGQQSDIVMCDVAYVPNASHMLILPQQLLDAGCRIIFDQLHGFQFFLDDRLRLLSY